MILSEEDMKVRKFGKLRMKDPKMITSGSGKKEVWVCDCGKSISTRIIDVILGHTTSCGRCNEISAEEMKTRKFGKLRMKDPKAILPGSNKKEVWICDCGKETLVSPSQVTLNRTSSCGRCNEISAEEMKTRKFGRLRMKDPKAILPNIIKKEIWTCDCGGETLASPNSVTSGNTKSCGRCKEIVQSWYIKNKDEIRSLKCPINPSEFPSGGLRPLGTIENVTDPFKAKCVLCGKIYYPRFDGVRLNKSMTCGCSSYRVSSAQKNISLFIESLDIITELEYEVNGLSYDIFIPSANLLIEYNGLRWHQGIESRERDQRKYRNAFGYSYLMIFEDEWSYNQDKVKIFFETNLLNLLP
jgi:hypothetical protein